MFNMFKPYISVTTHEMIQYIQLLRRLSVVIMVTGSLAAIEHAITLNISGF